MPRSQKRKASQNRVNRMIEEVHLGNKLHAYKDVVYQLAMRAILATPNLLQGRNPNDSFSVPVSVTLKGTDQHMSTEVTITVREVLNFLQNE
jgi:hypothetical protein